MLCNVFAICNVLQLFVLHTMRHLQFAVTITLEFQVLYNLRNFIQQLQRSYHEINYIDVLSTICSKKKTSVLQSFSGQDCMFSLLAKTQLRREFNCNFVPEKNCITPVLFLN